MVLTPEAAPASRPRMLCFAQQPRPQPISSLPQGHMTVEGPKRIRGSADCFRLTERLTDTQMRLEVCVVLLLLLCSPPRLSCRLPSFTPQTPQRQVGAGRSEQPLQAELVAKVERLMFDRSKRLCLQTPSAPPGSSVDSPVCVDALRDGESPSWYACSVALPWKRDAMSVSLLSV